MRDKARFVCYLSEYLLCMCIICVFKSTFWNLGWEIPPIPVLMLLVRNFPFPPHVRRISTVLLLQLLISAIRVYRMTKLGAMVIFNVICEKWNVVYLKYRGIGFMVLVVALKTAWRERKKSLQFLPYGRSIGSWICLTHKTYTCHTVQNTIRYDIWFTGMKVRYTIFERVTKSGGGLLYIHMNHVHILLFSGPSAVSCGRVLWEMLQTALPG
jgi:hypothetical protein